MQQSRMLVLAATATLLTCAVPAASAAPARAGHVYRAAHVCAVAASGVAGCAALVVVDGKGKPAVTGGPAGLNPVDIRSAYGLTSSASHGKTVAIVDAYDDPSAEADLGVYRARFGLSPCTSATGCFRKLNQTGATKLPRTDTGWATEISLDLDMVSATCPDCHILLVEASSASFTELGAAVNTAAKQAGVVAISNSYGGSDSGPLPAYDHPGIAITASTGDAGYGVESPASFRTVVAVGGTSLTKASNSRGWSESAWGGAGSGCSTRNVKPAWQSAATRCSGKANADVSAVADPRTGVSVYDTTSYLGRSGWQVYGGTSASAPIVASVYALSGNTAGYPASYTWAHTGSLHDVTTGSNGTCTPGVWCTAGAGWDGPTGVGTPNGVSAF